MFIGKSMRNHELGASMDITSTDSGNPEIAKGDRQKLPKFGNPVGFCAQSSLVH